MYLSESLNMDDIKFSYWCHFWAVDDNSKPVIDRRRADAIGTVMKFVQITRPISRLTDISSDNYADILTDNFGFWPRDSKKTFLVDKNACQLLSAINHGIDSQLSLVRNLDSMIQNNRAFTSAEFREISKFWFSSRNCHFWMKFTNIITRLNSWIWTKLTYKGSEVIKYPGLFSPL